MTKRTKSPQPTADGAFAIGTSLLTEKLERLSALAADHFNTDPDDLNWGHVGSLRYIEGLVAQALEHAEQLAR